MIHKEGANPGLRSRVTQDLLSWPALSSPHEPFAGVGSHPYVSRDRSNLPPAASGFHSQEPGPDKVIRVLKQAACPPTLKELRHLGDLKPAFSLGLYPNLWNSWGKL